MVLLVKFGEGLISPLLSLGIAKDIRSLIKLLNPLDSVGQGVLFIY